MKVAIIGAGKIGAALSTYFVDDPDTDVVILCDRNGQSLSQIEDKLNSPKLRTHRVGIEQEASITTLVRGFDFLISALPPEFNEKLTELALEINVNYIDLGGTDESLQRQMSFDKLARERDICIVPNSGMAPGLVNILALHGYEAFDTVESIQVRSAGLPKYPKPPLNYQLSFSPQALINEYLNNAIAIQNGTITEVAALEGLEEITFSSRAELNHLEAFYTSGQITSLAQMLEGKVNYLDFKTIRYKGHRDIIKTLFMLGFDSDQIIHIKTNLTYRELLIKQLTKNLPEGEEDLALIKITIEGEKEGARVERTYEMVCEYDEAAEMSALMRSAALPTVLIAKLIKNGEHKHASGVFPPEKIVPKHRFIDLLKEKGFHIHIEDRELA